MLCRVTIVNAALADILDRDAAEDEPGRLLSAIIEGGLFVPVDAAHSVMFVGVDERGPVLPGYVSEACLREQLPEAADAVHCDAIRLLDIVQVTKVERLAVFAPGGWATVGVPLLLHALREAGLQTTGQESVELSWSTHPLAIALRDGIRDRLLRFPGVRTVWVAGARWEGTVSDQLMVIAAADGGDGALVRPLMEELMSGAIPLTDDDPPVALNVIDPVAHAAFALDLDARGLDTVRADQGRVHVISREYDTP